VLIGIISSCNENEVNKNTEPEDITKGKLFIIGGGRRTPEMIKTLLEVSFPDPGGYRMILPFSSIEPDTALFYAADQFQQQGFTRIAWVRDTIDLQSTEVADSVRNARLIYIPGGDQAKFMRNILNTPVHKAIHDAYRNGSTIAGTSAGAAVMSRKMITGDQRKHPVYTGDFTTIESDNMILGEGLGLLPNVIIDQHFIRRMRMNRLITVALENPEYLCIGIDESTAIIVSGDSCKVIGNSQVIVIKNNNKAEIRNGLIGAEGMELSVFLPGDKFVIKD